MAAPKPFKIDVPEDRLQWINDRVRTARIPPAKNLPEAEIWKSWGLAPSCAQQLHQHWTTRYDWRAEEARINAELPQFTLPVPHGDEVLEMHFAHNRSPRPDAVPLMFVHGWPGSFLEVRHIVRALTHPESPDDPAFHVVAPSLPGFAFSSYPSTPCSPMDMVEVLHKLMLALGYPTFCAQAGDWGSLICRVLAARHPDACRVLHLNAVVSGPPSLFASPMAIGRLTLAYLTGGRGLTPFEQNGLKRMQYFMTRENGYQAIQGTKPQTLAYALVDSPFGLACWMREKVHYIVEDDYVWDNDLVITAAMMYILNGTAGHAEIYKWIPKKGEDSLTRAMAQIIPPQVAVGASLFPKDVLYVPEWWARANVASNIVFWHEHEKGGHFPAIEVPDALVADIRKFVGMVDKDVLAQMRQGSS